MPVHAPILTQLRQDMTPTARWLPLGTWILLMILTPVAQWSAGQTGFIALTFAGVLTQASAVLVVLSSRWPPLKLARIAAIALGVGWLAEFIGQKTGLPFGWYQYSGLLQPQVGGVPVLIPIAWLMMLPPAWAVASRIISPRRRFWFAAVTGLVFTAWDLYLDPQMTANGLWVWNQPGAYFGIPLLNFAGWWLVSGLITLLAAPADLAETLENSLARLLALVYTITWLLQVVGLGLFWGQPLPALCGFAGMGTFTLIFWIRELREY
jgi:uncharacterized membrane protein